MLSNAKIKLINSLKLAKYRKLNKLFVAEGTTNVIDFVNSNIQVREIFATEDWINKYEIKLGQNQAVVVDEKALKKVSFLTNPSEVLGVFHLPDTESIILENIDDLVLMFDDIRDPGNLGTIIRTADWFGIRQIICSEESVDAFNPKVVQASMGSLSRVKIHYADLSQLLKSKPDNLLIFGALLDGEPINKIDKTDRGIILIGNEARGISKDLMSFIDKKITIPATKAKNNASAESLNASIATAIICYEFRR